jgi:ActR/RegA family two-component response regulator
VTYREHVREAAYAAGREYLQRLFVETEGNLAEVARQSGLHRSTVYILMRKLQTKPIYRKRKAHDAPRWREFGL